MKYVAEIIALLYVRVYYYLLRLYDGLLSYWLERLLAIAGNVIVRHKTRSIHVHSNELYGFLFDALRMEVHFYTVMDKGNESSKSQ